MKHKIIYGAILLFALIAAWYLVWGRGGVAVEPDFSLEPTYQDGRIIIEGSEGAVSIADIYKLTNQRLSENEIIFLKKPEYQVMYAPETQGFLVFVYERNVARVAAQVEEDLLTTLDIDLEQLCSLLIHLRVPYSVNPEASGRNYNLPSCG